MMHLMRMKIGWGVVGSLCCVCDLTTYAQTRLWWGDVDLWTEICDCFLYFSEEFHAENSDDIRPAEYHS